MSDHANSADAAGSRPPPDPPGYELFEEVGRGGMGAVYRARDLAMHRDVAVKLLHERFPAGSVAAGRFLDEARITGQLQHPVIPAVHQVGELPGGRPFLAMKLIKGQTLEELIRQRVDLAVDRGRFLAIFEQACHGVGYAHARGVVHRDLKPANVMVGAFGEVQVMDWGLAKVLTERHGDDPHLEGDADTTLGTEIRSLRGEDAATQAGSLLGTPAYMAPEQAIGAIDQVDARTDVFGLGGILCAILTGRPPYVGADSESTRQLAARAKLDDAFARLDGCGADPELVALCRRCLTAERADRPADGDAVAQAVSRLRAEADERARKAELDRVRAEGDAREQRRRRQAQLAVGAAVLLLAAGGGAFAWWQDKEATRQRSEAAGRERDEAQRMARNSEAVEELLMRCEKALGDDDVDRAGIALDSAERRLAEGGSSHLQGRIDRCRADRKALRLLNSVDEFRWSMIDNKYPSAREVAVRWREAFVEFGFIPSETPPRLAADRVVESLIRSRVVAALDQWLIDEPEDVVAEVLGIVDPDAFRNRVRAAVARKDGHQVAALAGQPEALAQPPGFAAALGQPRHDIPPGRRRQILDAAVRRRPGDFALVMTYATSFPLQPWNAAAHERLRWFQVACAIRPRSVTAHDGLAAALSDTGQSEGGAAVARIAVELDPSYAPAYTNLGKALRQKGEFEGAAEAYRSALRLVPALQAGHAGLLRTYVEMKEYKKAIAAYADAIRHLPSDAYFHYLAGLAQKGLGDTNAAAACFQTALNLSPNWNDPFRELVALRGSVVVSQTYDDRAVSAAREAVDRDPKNAAAHLALGDVLLAKKHWTAAATAYREAIRLMPNATEGYMRLGDALGQANDLGGAVAAYYEAVRVNPKFDGAYVKVGNALLAKQDFEGAVTAFHNATNVKPTNILAVLGLGQSLRGKGDIDAAIDTYRGAARAFPREPHSRYELGRLLCQIGKLDEGIAIIREAIQLDPNRGYIHASLAAAYKAKGDADGLVQACKDVAQSNPKSADAYVALGDAHRGAKNAAEAIAAYRKALQLDPKRAPAAMRGLVEVVQETNEPGVAVAVYRELTGFEPTNAVFHASLGRALQQVKDFDGAVAALKESIRIDPAISVFHVSLAYTLRDQKDWVGAASAFREAIRLDPRYALSFAGLSDSLRNQNDLNGALEAAKAAIHLNPNDNGPHAALADVLFDMRDWDGAIAAYKEAIRFDSKNDRQHYKLGLALKAKGDRGGAVAALREAARLNPKAGDIREALEAAEKE